MTVPGTHIDNVHDENRSGLADEIEAAYGSAAAWETAKTTRDPISIATDLTAIPMRLWYSTDDTLCLPAEVTAFASLAGATATSIGAAGGHSISTLNTQQFIDYMEAEW